MKRLLAAAMFLVGGCNPSSSAPPSPPPPVPPVAATVTINGAAVSVEYRRTDPERREPLSGRAALPDGQGILCGWAHHRFIYLTAERAEAPFDVAFLSAQGAVTGTGALAAGQKAGITSSRESCWALIVPAGWLAKHDVKEADVASFSRDILDAPPQPMPEVRIGDQAVRVELSWTYAQRERGLMHRRALSANDGMLFMYPHASVRRFWMKDCVMSLDIAHFDADRRLLNVVTMDPYPDPATDTGERAESAAPAMYVLEVRKGWFRESALTDEGGRPVRELTLELPEEVSKIKERAE